MIYCWSQYDNCTVLKVESRMRCSRLGLKLLGLWCEVLVTTLICNFNYNLQSHFWQYLKNQVQSPIMIISCLIEITQINICNTTAVLALYGCCMLHDAPIQLQSKIFHRSGPSTQFFINLSFQHFPSVFAFLLLASW